MLRQLTNTFLNAKKHMNLAEFLTNEFEKRKNRNIRYSLRAFAKSLNIDAGALLRIMNNKRNATPSTALILLKNLNASQVIQNEILMELNSRNASSKKSKKMEMNTFFNHEFEKYFDILHIHTMEALNLKQFQSVEQTSALAEALGVSLSRTNEAINQLIDLGAVRIKNGQYDVLYKSFSTVPIGFTSDKRKRLQKEFLKKAIDAIDDIPFELRDHSTLTIPISRKDLAAIKLILKNARLRINSLSEKRSKRDQLYNLSLALYPVVL
ncbi:TIGR02147 family protein [Bdellovibrio svalbardensis]|uniref:TIGR02147 family protein n=1 Tax=Bdellovibrio svalbardensis TaxID=2972972 RepID=A0ABT6DG27_9BACT|nr:TIGR02147 family protein [Bdellovibrio svalbardensis]MDG0815805.1 TIGR02147 family protein [Bdellovibrio svalbardensis]